MYITAIDNENHEHVPFPKPTLTPPREELFTGTHAYVAFYKYRGYTPLADICLQQAAKRLTCK